MPFQRVQLNGEKVPDRTITGALRPPEPGITQSEDGIIVGSLGDPAGIKAGTEVVVTLPGPKEVLFDSRGIMKPRWYRFFSELHRRTGGTQDNVNFVPAFRKLPLEDDMLMITGIAPTVQIVHIRMMSVGSLALTGIAPTVAVA